MSDAVMLAVVAMIQGVCTAWLHNQVNKNACGSEACRKMIRASKAKA